ncbi:MAG: hypothetical protein KGZ82_04185 [Bacteroidales bacterium]|nr:hypothetical protein [Bacteroidales bacterium]
MAQYDLILVRNDAPTGVDFAEVTLSKPTRAGLFMTQNPGTGAFSWSDTLDTPVLNGTVSGTALISNMSNAATGKLVDSAIIKAYVDANIGANDAMVFKTAIDCSTNPNYPAADCGWTYRVSVAGKIGGASGPNVEVGDIMICNTDGTAAGNHATVGAYWNIIQMNLDGAIVDSMFSGTGLMKRTGAGTYAIVTDNSANWNSAYAWGNHAGLYTLIAHTGAGGAAHAVVTTSVNGFMIAADKTKLDGIATGANNYVHPSGDGNLHVPATSTTNNLKVLKAGATAGSLSWAFVDWGELTGKPATFTPASHTHPTSEVVGLDTALANKLDINGTAVAASKLATARTIAITGDGSWSVSFDGSGNVTGALTLASVVAANTFPKITFNAKGLVTGGSALSASDIPNLDASKITTGIFDVARIPAISISGVTGLQAALDLKMNTWVTAPATATATGTTGQLARDLNYLYICVNTNTWRRTTLAAW